ncbi:hypothetical protein Tco_0999671 [Tanacetum coccineum]
MLKKNFNQLSAMLYEALKEMLPSMVNKEVNKIAKMVVLIYVAEGLLLDRQKTHADVASMIVEAIQKEHDNLRAKIKFEKITTATACRHPLPLAQEIMMMLVLKGESSGTQEKLDELDVWMEDIGTDYDAVPDDKVSQDLWEEISEEIYEARLKKAINDMLRQRCNSGEEHRYHLEQMQNYLKSDIV